MRSGLEALRCRYAENTLPKAQLDLWIDAQGSMDRPRVACLTLVALLVAAMPAVNGGYEPPQPELPSWPGNQGTLELAVIVYVTDEP